METKLQDQQEFIFRSKLPKINIPNHLPLHSYCFQNISQHSSRPCIIDGLSGDTYTYAEVELIARKVAAGFNKLGIQQGDVILLLLPNSPEFLFALLGASYRGAVTTTANPFYTSLEIMKQVNASKVKLIITRACYAHKVRMISHLKIMCTDADQVEGCLHFSESCLQADENMIPAVTINSDEVAALLFSSGTTGVPKGVMLTHKNLVTNLSQQLDGENPNLYFHHEDVILCVLPLFHVYALNPVSLGALRAGAAMVVVGKFEVTMVMEMVEKYKVTFAPLVPPVVLAITTSPVVRNYDLSSIRMVMVGAAPLSKGLEDALRALLPSAKIGQAYGMTEAGPVLSMCLGFAKEPLEMKSGSCGTVVRNAEMKIVHLSTGASLPSNQVGEICIRGDQIMKGYLDNPEATRTTIDVQGWLHTGDIGYIDGDNELFIVDRLKELIKYKAFQVAPAELEALLISNINISDAAVVPMKDEVAGEVPVAFVVRTNGSKITEEDIIQYISKQVVFYKRIHRVYFVDVIPKSPSGKILRKDLRAKLLTKFPNTRPRVAGSCDHVSRI